jgi:hypothetical protein
MKWFLRVSAPTRNGWNRCGNCSLIVVLARSHTRRTFRCAAEADGRRINPRALCVSKLPRQALVAERPTSVPVQKFDDVTF